MPTHSLICVACGARLRRHVATFTQLAMQAYGAGWKVTPAGDWVCKDECRAALATNVTPRPIIISEIHS